jgi:hypothetical protein
MSNAIQLIVVIGLYALGIGLFRVLGGLPVAAKALERWGRTSSTVRQPDNRAP